MNNQSRPITPPQLLNKFNKQRYDSLDGLRAYAAVGIVLMHVLSNITLDFRFVVVIMSDSRKEPLLLILFTRSDMQGFCLILPAFVCWIWL